MRLHGILFTAEAEGLASFSDMFTAAISDFRTLLYYSAFGDALLLKMVVMCTFTVMTTAHPSEICSTANQVRSSYLSWLSRHFAKYQYITSSLLMI